MPPQCFFFLPKSSLISEEKCAFGVSVGGRDARMLRTGLNEYSPSF